MQSSSGKSASRYCPLMQYEVVKFIAYIILSHFWMLFEDFVFTPYIETLFVIVGVLIAEIKKKSTQGLYVHRREIY